MRGVNENEVGWDGTGRNRTEQDGSTHHTHHTRHTRHTYDTWQGLLPSSESGSGPAITELSGVTAGAASTDEMLRKILLLQAQIMTVQQEQQREISNISEILAEQARAHIASRARGGSVE